jgi:hypothetical protein
MSSSCSVTALQRRLLACGSPAARVIDELVASGEQRYRGNARGPAIGPAGRRSGEQRLHSPKPSSGACVRGAPGPYIRAPGAVAPPPRAASALEGAIIAVAPRRLGDGLGWRFCHGPVVAGSAYPGAIQAMFCRRSPSRLVFAHSGAGPPDGHPRRQPIMRHLSSSSLRSLSCRR